MIQSAMFFALGACVAGLLALWLAPMVWRRAVRVTERRVEAAIPLSIHEVQADKDQMRADFAVQLRKVEQKSETLHEKAAQDRVKINEQLARIEALAADRRAKAEIITGLEDRLEVHQTESLQLREQTTQLRSDLNGREARLKERVQRIRELEGQLRESENAGHAARIELAALETRGEDAAQKLRNAAKAIRALKEESAELKKGQREQKTALRKLERERDKANQEVDRYRSATIDLEERLDRRKAELARLKGQPAPLSVVGSASKAAKPATKPTTKPKRTPPKAKVAASSASTPLVKSAAASEAIEGQLLEFRSAIEGLDGKAPKTAAQRNKMMAQMDDIASQIAAANDVGGVQAAEGGKKLKGFRKPTAAQKTGSNARADNAGADNDAADSLSARIAGLHKLPAAE